MPPATTVAQALARVAALGPTAVCLAVLPPDGGPFARELSHHLRARFPPCRSWPSGPTNRAAIRRAPPGGSRTPAPAWW